MGRNEDNSNVQKIAVGTSELLATFYEETSREKSEKLLKAIANPNCEVYTTIITIAELYHTIQVYEYESYLNKNKLNNKDFSFEEFKKLENEKEKFKNKFASIYNKINNCMNIEKYLLDENFEEEYAKKYLNHSIFSFALTKFCQDNHIKSIL